MEWWQCLCGVAAAGFVVLCVLFFVDDLHSRAEDVQRLKEKRNVNGLIRVLSSPPPKLKLLSQEGLSPKMRARTEKTNAETRKWHEKKKVRKSQNRQAAANALGELKAREAIPPLITALKDEAQDVRKAAAEALGEMHGDIRAMQALIPLLNEHSSYASAAKALGKLGNLQAVAPLISGLKKEGTNRHAAEALDLLGWQPGTDEEKVLYWIAKERVDCCIELGDQAVGPLIKALDTMFQPAGKALVQLYHSDKLSQMMKTQVLNTRPKLTHQEHSDSHDDYMARCIDETDFYRGDYRENTHHDHYFGGIDFPL